eukprot:scaffold83634_cov66-Phaeocystis_antarctica.AAC.4
MQPECSCRGCTTTSYRYTRYTQGAVGGHCGRLCWGPRAASPGPWGHGPDTGPHPWASPCNFPKLEPSRLGGPPRRCSGQRPAPRAGPLPALSSRGDTAEPDEEGDTLTPSRPHALTEGRPRGLRRPTG